MQKAYLLYFYWSDKSDLIRKITMMNSIIDPICDNTKYAPKINSINKSICIVTPTFYKHQQKILH
jgi:hypothetical protein